MTLVRLTGIVAWLWLTAACTGAAPSQPSPPANLLLITIDTLRADRVGIGLAPALDGLAGRGLRFTNARTPVPLTLPSHVSLMTGVLPPAHGARLNGMRAGAMSATLAARLKRAGYRTGAVVGAFVLDRRFGLSDGFDSYDDEVRRDPAAVDQLQAERRADLVIDRALAWLKETPAAAPWLLWVHVYDPHAPYDAPNRTHAAASVSEAYDQEIAYADGELQRLISAVAAREDADHTAIIALGDHGESLGEHGEATHGMLLFDAALRVPLVIVAPGHAPAARADPVTTIDVLPTALALANQPPDPALPGRNLLQPVNGDRELYAETDYPAVAGWSVSRALVQDRWKLILGARPRLFDLANDAGETNDVASSRAQLVQAMSTRVDALSTASGSRMTGTPTAGPPAAVDAETAARLRALGYVAPTVAAPRRASGRDAEDDMASWNAFEQALSAQQAGRSTEALKTFGALAQQHPDAPIFQSSYARALAAANRPRDALSAFRRLVERWPTDAVLYHELAVAARAAGQQDEALRAEEAAITLQPDLAIAHNGLGLLHADAGRHADAARAFERAVEHDPTSASYLVNLGNASGAAGRHDRAAQAYRQALERDPTSADAANGLGALMIARRQPAEAVRWFEQAVASDPALLEAQLNLAIALDESGQRDRALRQYRVVETKAPPRSREQEAARTLRLRLERK